MDTDFETVRTPEIVRGLYSLGILGLLGIWVVIAVAGLLAYDFLGLVLGLVLVGPIVFALNLALGRLVCEALLLHAQAAEDLHAIRSDLQALLAARDGA